ncbi:hypothetical protein Tco_0218644 [Tanacetum coccineum]
MAVRTQPTLSPSYSARLTEAMTLLPSSFYTDTESDESKDEDTDSEGEEVASKDQQQQAVLAEDATEDEPLGLGNRAARHRTLERVGDTVPCTFEDGTVYVDIECDLPPARSPVQTLQSLVGTPVSPEWFPESSPVSLIVPSSVATLVPATALGEGDLL